MLTLSILPEHFAVCRLNANDPFPAWARSNHLLALVRTPDELSVVCAEHFAPPDVQAERCWRAIKVGGPLDFAAVGILAGLSTALAQAGISIFSISTYDTDYLLVKNERLEDALAALTEAGCVIE